MNNRELKFRVYIPDHEKFSYFRLGEFDYSDRYLYQHQYPVQQYTGLKDKNGVLIFEGDLVQYNQNSNYDGINFEVTWSDVSFGWVLKSKNGDYLTNMTTPNGPRYNFLEVVGSIFETKKDDNNE